MPTARFQPSFAAGVLGPGLHGRIDLAKYDVGLKEGLNIFIQPHGGAANRAGFEFICPVMDHTKTHRLIPFQRGDSENYIMLMGDQEMQIISDGAVLQDGGSDYTPSTPYVYTDLGDLDYVQSIDVMFFAHSSYFPQRMERNGTVDWTYADIDIDPTVTVPTGASGSASGSGSTTYTYQVTAVLDGVESFPTADIVINNAEGLWNNGAANTVSWTDSGADSYNVYRKSRGSFGYIGYTFEDTFRDAYIDVDLTISPPTAAEVFQAAGDYPSVVSMSQQRLLLAASTNQPETVWMSRTGQFSNFSKNSTALATSMIEMDMTGPEINKVRAMVQLRELLVFSSSGEFAITGPDNVLTALNPIQTQYGGSGSIGVKPLMVEDTALFVDRTGRSVRDFRYSFEQDGYAGNDLAIFASHYFEDKQIAGWSFAKSPHSIVWVYLDDGTLLSFTYKREHQVWAWCEHDVGGEVESVASIREGTEDAVYIIAKRTINGNTRRYVERLHSRQFSASEDCFFVDSGITVESGTAFSVVTGLDHLEGETVVALGDGDVFKDLTVASGQVTLPRDVNKVHVGLPYLAEMENLPPAIDLQAVGSARGRPHHITKLSLQVEKTRGVEVAPASRKNYQHFVQTGGDLSEDIPLFTGMITLPLSPEWNKDGTVVIRQRYPLPMTILGIAPQMAIGRTEG